MALAGGVDLAAVAERTPGVRGRRPWWRCAGRWRGAPRCGTGRARPGVVTAEDLLGLDEVDGLAPRRGWGGDFGLSDRVVAALLTELSGGDEVMSRIWRLAPSMPCRLNVG